MEAPAQERLLEEYRANIELWKHDDSLRQQRNTTFLTTTGLLLAAVGAVAAGSGAPTLRAGAVVVLSALGATFSTLWHRVQARNAEYIRFRRSQLRHIERELPGLSTFTNTHRAFVEGGEVTFTTEVEPFVVVESAKRSSTEVEGRLPLVLAVAWAATCAGAVTVALIEAL